MKHKLIPCMTMHHKILIIGCGNRTRCDDGLGIYAADLLRNRMENASLTTYQQLDISLAETIVNYDLIIFVDAGMINEPFCIRKISANTVRPNAAYTSVTSISEILNIAEKLYHKVPLCYAVIIKGYDFSFGEKLTKKGRAACDNAVFAITELLLLC